MKQKYLDLLKLRMTRNITHNNEFYYPGKEEQASRCIVDFFFVFIIIIFSSIKKPYNKLPINRVRSVITRKSQTSALILTSLSLSFHFATARGINSIRFTQGTQNMRFGKFWRENSERRSKPPEVPPELKFAPRSREPHL